MWSWHLWIAQPDVLKTTEVTCKTGQKFDFIQEPLGYKETMRLKSKEREVMVRVEQTYGPSSAKQSATFKIRQLGIDKTEAYATYYQHSRKDAFKYSRSEFPTITDKEVSIAMVYRIQIGHMKSICTRILVLKISTYGLWILTVQQMKTNLSRQFMTHVQQDLKFQNATLLLVLRPQEKKQTSKKSLT